MTQTFINPYQALALDPDATAEQIKSAYRALAKRYHPDSASNQGHTAVIGMFQQVTEAYQLLSDPEKRRKYDAIRKLLEAEEQEPDSINSIFNAIYQNPRVVPMSGSSYASHVAGASAMFVPRGRYQAVPPAPQPQSAPTPILVSQNVSRKSNGLITHASLRLLFTSQMMIQSKNSNIMATYAPGNIYYDQGVSVGVIDKLAMTRDMNGDVILDLDVIVQGAASIRSQP